MPITASIEAISQISLDAVIATDRDGEIVSWNNVTERIFGWSSSEVLGLPIHEVIIPEDERQSHLVAMDRFNKSGKMSILGSRIRTRALHKEGHEFPVELSVTLVGSPDGGHFVSFIRDLSKATAAEQKSEELNSALVRISRAAAAEEIASKLSHELAQPLTAIANLAATAKLILESEGAADSSAAAVIEQVSDSARKASAIIRSVRDLSLALKPETARFRLKPAVDEVIRLMDAAAASKMPAVVMIDDALMVCADRIKIQQVLLNLLRNASEAIAGSPLGMILVSAERLDGSVRLSISDNGPGIAEAMLPKMFHSVKSAKPKGMGIGLSICRTISEMHGGRIWLESKEGHGATFHVELPD